MTTHRALASAVLLVSVTLVTSCGHTAAVVCPETETRHWEVAPEWLQQRVSAAEIEAIWRKEIGFETIPEADRPGLLALFRANYATFSSKLRAGDELWFFSTPQRDWNAHAGRSGFVAIRDCRVVAVLAARESQPPEVLVERVEDLSALGRGADARVAAAEALRMLSRNELSAGQIERLRQLAEAKSIDRR